MKNMRLILNFRVFFIQQKVIQFAANLRASKSVQRGTCGSSNNRSTPNRTMAMKMKVLIAAVIVCICFGKLWIIRDQISYTNIYEYSAAFNVICKSDCVCIEN